MIDERKINELSRADIDDIELHFYAALENDSGSGDHWILMAVMDKYGFRTGSPTAVMRLAEEVIKLWYNNQK